MQAGMIRSAMVARVRTTWAFAWMVCAVLLPGPALAALNDAAFVSQSLPATMIPEQQYTVTIQMKNTGTASWQVTRRLIAISAGGAAQWGQSDQAVPSMTPSGSTATFTFTVRAPATPGTYAFQWQMATGGGFAGVAFGQATPAVNVVVQPLGQPPEVGITSPSSGDTFPVGAQVTITADASDADGTVQRVEFLRNGVVVGLDATAPYAFTYSPGPGGHVFTARAVDDVGNITTSLIVPITIASVPPTATLTAPTDGATYESGNQVTLTATANDSDGTIRSVAFLRDGTVISTDFIAPYSAAMSATAGTHVLTARATDNNDTTGTSAPITITVNAGVPPTVSVTSPVSGQSLVGGANVALSADAADADGTIARVEFLVDGSMVGQDTTSPYSANATIPAGSHTIRARAYDNQGNMTLSQSVSVTASNAPSTVAITSPTPFQSYAFDEVVQLTATASDVDSTISRVEFWIDGIMRANDYSAPYAITWPVDPGNHSAYAKAFDQLNATAVSSTIVFTVRPPNILPTIALTSPVDGDLFLAGTQIRLSADAADNDGNVARVEFWVDGAKIADDTAAPYETLWSGAVGEGHLIKAIVVDSAGATATSATVSIGVRVPLVPPINVTLTRRLIYDAQQRVCKIVDPETQATVMHYDEAGNVDWSLGGLGFGPNTSCDDDYAQIPESARVKRSYDARGRPTTLVFPDGEGNQVWNYEADGLPSQVRTMNSGQEVINTYSYNHRRLLVGESVNAESSLSPWTIGYAYDVNGHLSAIQHPGGEVVSFSPDALGRPSQVSSAYAAYATQIDYFPNGALRGFTYGNGIKHSMEQNTRQLPERSRDDYNGAAVLDDSYDYDKLGNVMGISDAAQNGRGDRTMAYDGLDRLIAVDSPMFGADGARYGYDSVDNLVTLTAPGRKHTYWYDQNRLVTVLDHLNRGVGGIGYDSRGNVSNKDGTRFTFDVGNRLRAVSYDNSSKETYKYDAFGRRVVASAPSGSIFSEYDQSGVLRYQRDLRRGLVINYIYLSGSLIAFRETTIATGQSTFKFQHTDALGTAVAATALDRSVVARHEYEPFGALVNQSVADGPGYTGHVSDAETGMIYMQQRYYDPLIGRFMSVDPVYVSPAGGNFNRYWYANNNPYRFTDPDGRVAQKPSPCAWCDYTVYGSYRDDDTTSTTDDDVTNQSVAQAVADGVEVASIAKPNNTIEAAIQNAIRRGDITELRLLLQQEGAMLSQSDLAIANRALSAMETVGAEDSAMMASRYGSDWANTAKHALEGLHEGPIGRKLLSRFGSSEKAVVEIQKALDIARPATRWLGFGDAFEAPIVAGGVQVTVRGVVIDGMYRISTVLKW